MRPKYTHTINTFEDYCVEKGDVEFAAYIKDIESMMNLQDYMLAAYRAMAYLDGVESEEYMLMSVAIITKNLDYIYNALELNRKGQYAAARVIFRNVYESLIILKTVALTKNEKLLSSWIEGEEINLRREIFSQITHPKSEEMKRLWNDLCRFCHGTVFSCQALFDYDKAKHDIEYNYIVIMMLLYMNYHVLNRYVFSENMKAQADRMIFIEGEESIKEKRKILRDMFRERKQALRKEPRKVLTDFSKVWKFKEYSSREVKEKQGNIKVHS